MVFFIILAKNLIVLKTIVLFIGTVFFISISNLFSQTSKIRKIDSLHKLYITNQNNNLLLANQYANKALMLSQSIKNDSLILISTDHLISILLKKRKNEKALELAIKNRDLANNHANKKYLCSSFLYLGGIYRRLSEYEKAYQNIEKGLSIAQNYNLLSLQHQLLNAKVVLLKKTKRYNEAKQLLKNILKEKKFKDPNNISYTFNSLASIYLRQERKLDSSAIFFEKAIDLAQKANNIYLQTLLYTNYSDFFSDKGNKKKALNYLKKGESLANLCSDNANLFFINSSLGYHYSKSKNYKKAIKHYKTAIDTYSQYADGTQIANNYWLLADALYYDKQYEEGFLYIEEVIYLNDSLFNIDKNKTFEKLQTEYEVEKKNNTITFLEKEQQLKSQKLQLVYAIGGLVLFVLVLLIFVYRYKIRAQKRIEQQNKKLYQQEKEQLQQAQKIKRIESFIEGQEIEKNRIALELHDGIAGDLAGIKHLLHATNRENKNVEILKITENLDVISHEVRSLSHSLNSNYILQTPFLELLLELKNKFETSKKIKIELDIYPKKKINTLGKDKKHHLYRIIQELIHNAIKHSKSTIIHISFTFHNTYTSLLIEDNGTGFDKESKLNGTGFKNISDRVDKFDGTLHIDSTLGKGTVITIEIPK